MAYVNNPPQFGGLGSGFGGGYGGISPTAGIVPGTIYTSPTFPTGTPGYGSGGTGAGGFWGWLAGMGRNALQNPAVWMAGAQMLASSAESQAQNRMEAQKREKDNMDLLQRTDYINNRPANLDTYTTAPSSRARQSADDLQEVLMKRLENASAGPGIFERLAGYAAPAAAICGATLPGGSSMLFPQARR